MEGRTESPGHLVAWGAEEPGKDKLVRTRTLLLSEPLSLTWSYLWSLGLTDSESLSEIGIHSIVGFPFSLRWFDPVGDDLR